MKTVLCYGDSNTWGYNAATAERFGPHERWTGVLQAGLGPAYRVIEEGLNGRTTVWPDPVEGEHKNGKPYSVAVPGIASPHRSRGADAGYQRHEAPLWPIGLGYCQQRGHTGRHHHGEPLGTSGRALHRCCWSLRSW